MSYYDLPDGAQIVYRTDERALAAAVADWFDAQLRDHGSDAKKGEPPSDSDHSDLESREMTSQHDVGALTDDRPEPAPTPCGT